MQVRTLETEKIAIVTDNQLLVEDVQSALDLMMSIQYETNCQKIILHKSNLPEAFFDLKTQLAGEILQKVVNYGLMLAVAGDYSGYTRKSLHDFMYESNQGNAIFFVTSEDEAIQRLSK